MSRRSVAIRTLYSFAAKDIDTFPRRRNRRCPAPENPRKFSINPRHRRSSPRPAELASSDADAAATPRWKVREKLDSTCSDSRFCKQSSGTLWRLPGRNYSVILADYNDTARTTRRTERTSTGRLFFGTSEYGCNILNISPGGAQIRLSQPIATWATVTLVIDSVGALHCRVLWQRGETIALQFVQSANWVNGKILARAS
jgi:hypothetical protein